MKTISNPKNPSNNNHKDKDRETGRQLRESHGAIISVDDRVDPHQHHQVG